MSEVASPLSKVEKLKNQREQLNARISRMEATEKSKHRKQDTRRKILIGAYYLEQAQKKDTVNELYRLMNGFLTRDSDRVLFALANQ